MPKYIAISSIYRTRKYAHEAGRVYVIDYTNKNIVNVSPGVTENIVRHVGHSVGFRGISYYSGRLCVVTSDNRLMYYDADSLNLVTTVDLSKHGVFEAHQVKSHLGVLYVVSTGNNSYARLDGTTVTGIIRLDDIASELVWLVKDAWKKTNHWPSDKLHFNSIGWDRDGDEYHLYFAAGVLYNYTKKEIVLSSDLLYTSHDLAYHNGCFYVSASISRTVYKIDIASRSIEKVFSVDDYESITQGMLTDYAFYRHVRGLWWEGSSLFICCSPVKLYEMHEDEHGHLSLAGTYDYSNTPYESVYDLVIF